MKKNKKARKITYTEKLARDWLGISERALDIETNWWARVALGQVRAGDREKLSKLDAGAHWFAAPKSRREAQRAVVRWEVAACASRDA